jgi:hypothetical protein
MSLASQVHLDIKDIKSEVDAIRGMTDAAKAAIDWVKLQMVWFLPLIDMGVDAYTTFEQHKKVQSLPWRICWQVIIHPYQNQLHCQQTTTTDS